MANSNAASPRKNSEGKPDMNGPPTTDSLVEVFGVTEEQLREAATEKKKRETLQEVTSILRSAGARLAQAELLLEG